jgi:hypothetical protein
VADALVTERVHHCGDEVRMGREDVLIWRLEHDVAESKSTNIDNGTIFGIESVMKRLWHTRIFERRLLVEY